MADEPPKERYAMKYVGMSCLRTFFFIHSLYLKRILYPRAAFSAVCVQYLKKVFATIDI